MWVQSLFAIHTFAMAWGFVWSLLPVLPFILNLLWHGWVIGSSFFVSCFLPGLGFAWAWAFSSSIMPLSSLWVSWHICHVDPLFLPCYHLTCACWACCTLSFCLVPIAQYYCWACTYTISGFLGPFYSFGHLWLVSFPQTSLAHSNPSFTWALAKSFGLLQPKLPYPLLLRFNYHILYF